jgi:hypothetical protein
MPRPCFSQGQVLTRTQGRRGPLRPRNMTIFRAQGTEALG